MSNQASVEDQKVIGGDNVVAKDDSNKDFKTMNVKVYSPFREYYDGIANSLTAENATGVFDILPQHHSFISLLVPCELIIRTPNAGDLTIKISGGLCHVKSDKVIIFLDV